MKTVSIRIVGNVCGPIWLPPINCTKKFDRTFYRVPVEQNIRRGNEIDCLRDILLKITNDGDFRHCEIEYAVLIIRKQKGNLTIERSWELRGAGYNADCFMKMT